MTRLLLALALFFACSSTDEVVPPPTPAEACRKDAESRINAMCERDVWRDHTPTKADLNDMVAACLNPTCVDGTGVVPCSVSCSKAKLALTACESGYKCDPDTEMPVVSYSCADYAARNQEYGRACF